MTTPTREMRFLLDFAEKDASELRDIARLFELRGENENAKFLRRTADRHEIYAGAYDTAANKAGAFFGWFNKHYPQPSNHADHPWCMLGDWLVQRQRHEDESSK